MKSLLEMAIDDSTLIAEQRATTADEKQAREVMKNILLEANLSLYKAENGFTNNTKLNELVKSLHELLEATMELL